LPVAVIVPAHNRADTLRRSLASACSQRPLLPAEVIVVDDGSSDDTSTVASSMGARVIRHPRNLGPSAARNSGVNATDCPWVAFLDSDDEWLPHHLAHLWDLRADHVLVAGSSLRCGENPAADRFHGPVTRKPAILSSADRLVFPGNIIPTSGSMARRDAVVAVGGFRPPRGVAQGADLCEDLDLWLRLLERGTGVCSPRVSVIYRVHDTQLSRRDPRPMQLAHLDAAEAHRRRTGGSSAPIRRWEAVAAWDNLRDALAAGERSKATRWALHIASRPGRVVGLVGILTWRYLVRRRSAALRAAGVGPADRKPGGVVPNSAVSQAAPAPATGAQST
jgi:GT2 family glycosyltransferase